MLYEDDPEYGLLLKLLMVAVPGLSLAGSIYLWLSGETSGSLTLLAEAFIIAGTFSAILPRKYQVYEDHLRVVLGGPLSVKAGYEAIKEVRVTRMPLLTMNFVTRMARRHVVIVRKRGMSIAITPRDNDEFAAAANRAMTEWAKARGSGKEQ